MNLRTFDHEYVSELLRRVNNVINYRKTKTDKQARIDT